jgi:hypothetical protein
MPLNILDNLKYAKHRTVIDLNDINSEGAQRESSTERAVVPHPALSKFLQVLPFLTGHRSDPREAPLQGVMPGFNLNYHNLAAIDRDDIRLKA